MNEVGITSNLVFKFSYLQSKWVILTKLGVLQQCSTPIE